MSTNYTNVYEILLMLTGVFSTRGWVSEEKFMSEKVIWICTTTNRNVIL